MSDVNSKPFMLTTKDNPFNPYTDFDNWFAYDEGMGYHSCSYLARIAMTANSLSDEENRRITEAAIDEIIYYNPEIYKRAYES